MHYHPLIYMYSGRDLANLKMVYLYKNTFSSLNFRMHIFIMSVTYLHSIKKDTPKHRRSLFHKVCTITNIANTMQLEVQNDITLAILILQSPYPYQTCIIKWLRCGANLIKIRQTLHKLLNNNIEMFTEGQNDRQAENSIPPKLRLRGYTHSIKKLKTIIN